MKRFSVVSKVAKQAVITCIVCKNDECEVFLNVDSYTYYRCKKCSGVFANPIHERKFYLDTKTYLNNPKKYTKNINLYGQRWMIEEFEKFYEQKKGNLNRGKFFEIGAGVGFLELFALARGWNTKAIEISGDAVKFAQDYLRVDIEQSTIEDYKDGVKYDAVVMVEVLEHFTDPLQAVEHIRKICKPEGTIFFGTTPNTDSAHWKKSKQNIYVPDDHIFLFNKKSLKIFAEQADIENMTIQFFGSGDRHDSNLMFAGVIKG